MNVADLIKQIDQVVPFDQAESWDNVGLLIGDKADEITGILTTLDCTMAVVEEAISLNCNVIIAHHPLIFSGIKSINEDGYYAIIRKLIRENIHLIAMHTNLDHYEKGVSYNIAQALGLKDTSILLPLKSELYHLQTYVTRRDAKQLKDALAEVGVGKIGNYDHCFFTSEGIGEFRGNQRANPYVGNVGELHYEDEVKIEGVFNARDYNKVINQLIYHHPYETPAYQCFKFEVDSAYGTGIRALCEAPMTLEAFAKKIKMTLNLDCVKLIGNRDAEIKTVGIIGGAGFDFYKDVKNCDVDVFLTGDIKYHEAHDLKMLGLNTIDISHYSEHVMKQGLVDILNELNIQCPLYASKINTDPFEII